MCRLPPTPRLHLSFALRTPSPLELTHLGWGSRWAQDPGTSWGHTCAPGTTQGVGTWCGQSSGDTLCLDSGPEGMEPRKGRRNCGQGHHLASSTGCSCTTRELTPGGTGTGRGGEEGMFMV